MDIIDNSNSVFKISGKIDVVDLAGMSVHCLRLDQIHPIVSGNKWFKLKYNLAHALAGNASTILTFGGAYSNHLIATAAAAEAFGLESIGMVRGAHRKENLTPTLKRCEDHGMQLQFISREEYNQTKDMAWLHNLQQQHRGSFIIPEGGNNGLGIQGAAEIASLIPADATHVILSVGSGATFTGIRNALDEHIQILGFAPMKNGRYLEKELQPSKQNWKLIDDYHFGGFGKWKDDLIVFMNEFYHLSNIPLDVVYTGKMLYGLKQLISSGYFPANAKIVCIHTGGLQGNASVQERLNYGLFQ